MFSRIVKGFRKQFSALHLTNSNPLAAPGGLERYVLESTRFAAEELGINSRIVYPGGGEAPELSRLHSLHLQHSMNWDQGELFELCRSAAKKTKITRLYLHDYHFLCRQHNLFYNDREFCGPPESVGAGLCSSCKYGPDVIPHRDRARKLFDLFSMIVSPSESAKKIFCRGYPELVDRVHVVPHRLLKDRTVEDQLANAADKKICIVFSGACGFNKGIERYAELIETFGPRFRWATVGIEDRFKGNPLVEHYHYSFHESGSIVPILEGLKPAVAFLGGLVPETFSFTLHEMLEAGIPVLTTGESGNIEATVERLGCGMAFATFAELKGEMGREGALNAIVKNSQRYRVVRNVAGLAMLYGAR